MTKLMDSIGRVFAEGENIDEILKELNDDPNGSNEWRYCYNPSDYVVYAYYVTDGKEELDEVYDVLTMKYSNIATIEQFRDFLKDVNDADYWSVFEPEEYKSACRFAGLNYSDYKDLDSLFADLRKFEKENEMEKGGEER